jgi:hypothetical protein
MPLPASPISVRSPSRSAALLTVNMLAVPSLALVATGHSITAYQDQRIAEARASGPRMALSGHDRGQGDIEKETIRDAAFHRPDSSGGDDISRSYN